MRAAIFAAHLRTGRRTRNDLDEGPSGAAAGAWGVGYVGLAICHEQIRSFRYAYTMSAALGVVIGLIAYHIMMRTMRRLP
jgi:hypothetical protein